MLWSLRAYVIMCDTLSRYTWAGRSSVFFCTIVYYTNNMVQLPACSSMLISPWQSSQSLWFVFKRSRIHKRTFSQTQDHSLSLYPEGWSRQEGNLLIWRGKLCTYGEYWSTIKSILQSSITYLFKYCYAKQQMCTNTNGETWSTIKPILQPSITY